jgi:hypothetical protein
MEPTPSSVVRAWARDNGYEVSDRGRVPVAVQRAFDEAHAADVTTAQAPEAPAAPAAAGPASDVWAGPTDVGGQPPAASTWSTENPWGDVPPAPPPSGRDGFSIAALVLGIIPVLAGLLGIIFGAAALRRIKRTGQAGRRMAITGIVLGSLWLGGLIAAVAAGLAIGPERDESGTITEGGVVSASDLQVNDCVKEEPVAKSQPAEESVDVDSFDVVPCSQPHEASVYAIFPLGGKAYPGDAQVTRFAQGGCERQLTKRFGTGGPREYFYLTPTKQGWTAGDRDVTCLVAPAKAKG